MKQKLFLSTTAFLLMLQLRASHAAAIRIHPSSSLPLNSTTTLEPTIAHPHNTTGQPLTFLGVDCYYLQPETVSAGNCQPLFAKMFGYGHVYEKMSYRNGWWFKLGHEPCTIKIESSVTEAWNARINLSTAEIVRYASQVLEECKGKGEAGSGTGGANNIGGDWRIVVTRNLQKFAAFAGRVGDE